MVTSSADSAPLLGGVRTSNIRDLVLDGTRHRMTMASSHAVFSANGQDCLAVVIEYGSQLLQRDLPSSRFFLVNFHDGTVVCIHVLDRCLALNKLELLLALL